MKSNKHVFQYSSNEKEYLQNIQSLLNSLKECVLESTEQSWVKASEIIKILSTLIPLTAYHKIGEIWSDSYVKPLSDEELEKRMQEVFELVKKSRKK